MVKTTPAMTRLYNRLSGVGLTRSFIQETVLPDWWDDTLAENPAGYSELILLLARHLGLSLASLQDEVVPLALRDFGLCKFKKTKGTKDDELAIARAIGTRAAQLAATATAKPYRQVPSSALDIRLQILDSGARWVGLEELLKYCWSIGVPVVQLARLPKRAKKMHGMAAIFKGRPVIVICKMNKPTAWLLFILAHELGHIASGHVAEGGVILDQDVKNNERDNEEEEANAFALELLTGSPDFCVHAASRWPDAARLAEVAKAIGIERHVHPGHVVLNYAYTMGPEFWGVANAALKILEPRSNAPLLVRSTLAARLDWSALPEDSCEFLMRVTKAEP